MAPRRTGARAEPAARSRAARGASGPERRLLLPLEADARHGRVDGVALRRGLHRAARDLVARPDLRRRLRPARIELVLDPLAGDLLAAHVEGLVALAELLGRRAAAARAAGGALRRELLLARRHVHGRGLDHLALDLEDDL